MKTRLWITIFAVALVMIFQSCSFGNVWITDVDVLPAQPSMSDVITLSIFGVASDSPSWVEYEEFSQDGTSLFLDLHINMGFDTMLSYWSYSKQIQSLPPATYTLQVRAFDNYYGTLDDTHTVSFTVTPEPATLALFVLGLPVFRRFTRRHARDSSLVARDSTSIARQ